MSSRRCVSALVAALCISGVSAEAAALEPTNSATITKSSFTALAHRAVDDGQTSYLGVAECRRAAADDISVTVRFESSINLTTADLTGAKLLQNVYTFGVDRGVTSSVDCATAGACTTLSSGSLTQSGTKVDATVKFRELTGVQGAADCEAGTLDREYFVRIAFKTSTSSTTIDTEDVRLVLDTVRPTPPLGFDALLTEEQLQIGWDESASSDVESYGVFYSTQAFSGGVLPEELSGVTRAGNILAPASGTRGEVKASLTAGETLYVGISARDEALNDSTVIGPEPYEVIATTDFWEDYKARGGVDGGGYCAAAGGGSGLGLWPVMVMMGAAGARRRRRG
jgi:hypothetical protein